MTFEEELNQDLIDILEELGTNFEVTRPLASTISRATLRPEENQMVFNCKGIFYDSTAAAIKSGWEQSVGADAQQDLKYIILKPLGTDEPKNGDICQALNRETDDPEGRPVIVTQVNPVGPYGAPLYWRVAAE